MKKINRFFKKIWMFLMLPKGAKVVSAPFYHGLAVIKASENSVNYQKIEFKRWRWIKTYPCGCSYRVEEFLNECSSARSIIFK